MTDKNNINRKNIQNFLEDYHNRRAKNMHDVAEMIESVHKRSSSQEEFIRKMHEYQYLNYSEETLGVLYLLCEHQHT